MAYKVFENGFSQGWNQDTDPRFQENTTYRNPVNVSVTAEGNFYSCRNISGNREVDEFITSIIGTTATDVNVLGSFPVVGTYGPDKDFSILYFVKVEDASFPGGHEDRIIMYNLVQDISVTLLATNPTVPNHLNFPREGTIDAVVFGENNIDKVYFDDHTNVLRKVDAIDIPLTNPKEVTAIPYAPIDPIEYSAQETGSGQLPSGSYQIGYRYFNTDTKKYTKWSLVTNPIPVFPIDFADVTSLDEIYGGVANEATKKSIIVSVDKTTENSDIYDSIQLVIVKNISGNVSPPVIAYVTAPSKEYFNDPTNIIYDGSGLETTIDIAELGVDDACISAKTLVAKDNVLFRGNLKYHDRLVESFTYTGAKTIKEQLGLTSSVYLPQTENTNNPQLNHLGQIRSGQTSLQTYQPTDPDLPLVQIARINAEKDGFDLLEEGSSGIFSNLQPGKNVLNDFGNSQSIWSFSDLVPGNEIVFTIRGYKEAFRESTAGGEQYKFEQDYLNNSYAGQYDPLNNHSIGMSPDLAVIGYRYVVQNGETEEDVIFNIVTELNSILDSSKARLEIDTADPEKFKILSEYGRIFNGGIQRETFGLLDVIGFIEQGVDLSISQTEAALEDIASNPNSTQGGYKNPRNTVKAKGYFRDEVYRFGITWMDEFGCWSQPLPFDFSDHNARNVTSFGHTIAFHEVWGENFMRFKPTDPAVTAQFEVGDYVGVQKLGSIGLTNDIVFLQIQKIFPDGSVFMHFTEDNFEDTIIYDDFIVGDFTLAVTEGAELSHSLEGTDWKFPERENLAFPMMSVYDESIGAEVKPEDGFIQPLGLCITGIGGHPTWAKAFAIVSRNSESEKA
jgi:hypothetical protein